LDRAEIRVDTAQLAHFLIGKMLVRILAEGVAGGRIVAPRHMASATNASGVNA
jgi:3-methyladenine DNA glycosylase Mpg